MGLYGMPQSFRSCRGQMHKTSLELGPDIPGDQADADSPIAPLLQNAVQVEEAAMLRSDVVVVHKRFTHSEQHDCHEYEGGTESLGFYKGTNRVCLTSQMGLPDSSFLCL